MKTPWLSRVLLLTRIAPMVFALGGAFAAAVTSDPPHGAALANVNARVAASQPQADLVSPGDSGPPEAPSAFVPSVLPGHENLGGEQTTPVQREFLVALGQTGGLTRAVAVEYGLTYLGVGLSLVVLDTSNRTRPRALGQTGSLRDLVRTVVVVGKYAYVGLGSTSGGGFSIIDIADPTRPGEVGFYDTEGSVNGVAVAGNYAYIHNSPPGSCELGPCGLMIIDISNPARPARVGAFLYKGDMVGYGPPYGVAVAGKYVYATVGDRFRVIDVTDPTRPTEAGSWGGGGFVFSNFALAGGLAYATGGSAALVGTLLYVVDGGFGILDVSNPQDIRLVNSYTSTDYVAGLDVIDVADPSHPTEVGFYQTRRPAARFTVSGDYAYVAMDAGGLSIVNVADPTKPREAGYFDTLYAAKVRVSGSYAYVADVKGLRTVNVSNRADPAEVGFYDIPPGASGVAISDTFAYVTSPDGLHVVSTADPTRPQQLGFISAIQGQNANDVAVAGNYAYIAEGNWFVGWLHVQ